MTEVVNKNTRVEHRKEHLRDLGLRPVGKTGFYQTKNEGFVVDIDQKTGGYSFFVNYLMSSLKPRHIQSLAVDTSSDAFNLKIQHYNSDKDRTQRLEYDLDGGGGGIFDQKVVEKLEQLSQKRIVDQLIQAGFTHDTNSPGVWKIKHGEDRHGEREVIVLVEDGKLSRILQSIDPRRLAPYKIDEEAEIIQVREDNEKQRPVDVLTLENDIVRIDITGEGVPYIHNVKLLREFTPQEIGVGEYVKHPDKTSPQFSVGGVNTTEVIRSLQALNGNSIAKLEEIMRPNNRPDHRYSTDGFIGHNESLVSVLAEDNDFVLGLRLTHQEMAEPLKYVKKLFTLGYGKTFTLRGNDYQLEGMRSLGPQSSPFRDDAGDGRDTTIINLSTGESLHCGLLVADLIDRWGFYEGKGTSYRVEPESILKVFPYLQELSRQRMGE